MGYKKFSGGKFFKFEEEGQQLEGIWDGYRESTNYKGTYNGFINVDGERIVFGLSTAIEDMMVIPVGTQVKVVYIGKQVGKSGRQFKAYEVYVDEDMQPAQASLPETGSDSNEGPPF
jgi:hypothetical protein